MKSKYTCVFIGIGGIILLLIGMLFIRNISQYISATQNTTDFFEKRLLYLRGCTIGNIRSEYPEGFDSLEEQIAYCDINLEEGDAPAGYYLYDFDTRKSVYLDQDLMDTVIKQDLLTFPTSIYHDVQPGKSASDTLILRGAFATVGIFCEEKYDQIVTINCTTANETYDIPLDSKWLDLIFVRGLLYGPHWDEIVEQKLFPSNQ